MADINPESIEKQGSSSEQKQGEAAVAIGKYEQYRREYPLSTDPDDRRAELEREGISNYLNLLGGSLKDDGGNDIYVTDTWRREIADRSVISLVETKGAKAGQSVVGDSEKVKRQDAYGEMMGVIHKISDRWHRNRPDNEKLIMNPHYLEEAMHKVVDAHKKGSDIKDLVKDLDERINSAYLHEEWGPRDSVREIAYNLIGEAVGGRDVLDKAMGTTGQSEVQSSTPEPAESGEEAKQRQNLKEEEPDEGDKRAKQILRDKLNAVAGKNGSENISNNPGRQIDSEMNDVRADEMRIALGEIRGDLGTEWSGIIDTDGSQNLIVVDASKLKERFRKLVNEANQEQDQQKRAQIVAKLVVLRHMMGSEDTVEEAEETEKPTPEAGGSGKGTSGGNGGESDLPNGDNGDEDASDGDEDGEENEETEEAAGERNPTESKKSKKKKIEEVPEELYEETMDELRNKLNVAKSRLETLSARRNQMEDDMLVHEGDPNFVTNELKREFAKLEDEVDKANFEYLKREADLDEYTDTHVPREWEELLNRRGSKFDIAIYAQLGEEYKNLYAREFEDLLLSVITEQDSSFSNQDQFTINELKRKAQIRITIDEIASLRRKNVKDPDVVREYRELQAFGKSLMRKFDDVRRLHDYGWTVRRAGGLTGYSNKSTILPGKEAAKMPGMRFKVQDNGTTREVKMWEVMKRDQRMRELYLNYEDLSVNFEGRMMAMLREEGLPVRTYDDLSTQDKANYDILNAKKKIIDDEKKVLLEVLNEQSAGYMVAYNWQDKSNLTDEETRSLLTGNIDSASRDSLLSRSGLTDEVFQLLKRDDVTPERVQELITRNVIAKKGDEKGNRVHAGKMGAINMLASNLESYLELGVSMGQQNNSGDFFINRVVNFEHVVLPDSAVKRYPGAKGLVKDWDLLSEKEKKDPRTRGATFLTQFGLGLSESNYLEFLDNAGLDVVEREVGGGELNYVVHQVKLREPEADGTHKIEQMAEAMSKANVIDGITGQHYGDRLEKLEAARKAMLGAGDNIFNNPTLEGYVAMIKQVREIYPSGQESKRNETAMRIASSFADFFSKEYYLNPLGHKSERVVPDRYGNKLVDRVERTNSLGQRVYGAEADIPLYTPRGLQKLSEQLRSNGTLQDDDMRRKFLLTMLGEMKDDPINRRTDISWIAKKILEGDKLRFRLGPLTISTPVDSEAMLNWLVWSKETFNKEFVKNTVSDTARNGTAGSLKLMNIFYQDVIMKAINDGAR